MPVLKQPVPRWEPIRISCDAYEAKTLEGPACTDLLERHDTSFHYLFLALRARYHRLIRITIEGIRLLPTDSFYGTDILMDVGGALQYPPLEEVARLMGEAGLPHFP